ncbi:hypothetical protein ERM14_17275 [Clostridioides difficile]|nr:hypothetical protein [Clostridioides difficile]EGT4048351.1 hypothetical protein [Clostridioides difficile]EGT4223954.1 hypothetical protein [Clostridioides difficile]EGT5089538.1 hypothetical protein [Clostridioides difficile]EGT5494138.1 hypothetical protein [Clostridioides difficile]
MCFPSFLTGVWGLPQQAETDAAQQGGAGRFSGVWLHSLCLLRFLSSATTTPETLQSARKIPAFSEKNAKK